MPAFTVSPPAVPAVTFTALASFRAPATPRACTVTINWLQPSGTPSTIKPASTSTPANDNTTGWTQAAVTDTAPADATQATITVNVAGCAAGETHETATVGIFPGTTTMWTRGGLVGSTTATVTRNDGNLVRAANNTSLPAPSQQTTVNDYEIVPGIEYSYTATVEATV